MELTGLFVFITMIFSLAFLIVSWHHIFTPQKIKKKVLAYEKESTSKKVDFKLYPQALMALILSIEALLLAPWVLDFDSSLNNLKKGLLLFSMIIISYLLVLLSRKIN